MEAPAQVLCDKAETTGLMDALDQVLSTRLLQLSLGWHVPRASLILPMPAIPLQIASIVHARSYDPACKRSFTAEALHRHQT